VAARLAAPGSEWTAFRALQLAWFTSTLVLDRDKDIATALEGADGLDVPAIVGAIDRPDVIAAYEADKAETRTAEGSPTAFQGKAAATDGPVRYTAPSLMFARDGQRLEAGGFQTIEAYDVLVANLDPALARRAPPDNPAAVLEAFAGGLTTQEVAAVMAPHNLEPDRAATEDALIHLSASGSARRLAVADDAVWLGPTAGSPD